MAKGKYSQGQGRGAGGGGDHRSAAVVNLRDWTQGIHRALLEDRGISLSDLGKAMGVSRERARQFFAQQGYSEEIALRIEDAIDQISQERGLVPAQAMSWPEGAPAPEWVSEEALGELEYRRELTTKNLMRLEGRPHRGNRFRRQGTRGSARRVG